MQNVLNAKDVVKFGMRGFKEYVDYNWHGKVISIRYLLSHKEVIDLYQRVEEMITRDDGTIMHEHMDFAVKLAIVSTYACIELPDDIDTVYNLIYHSDIFDVVMSNANKNQLSSIVHYFELSR